VTFAARLGPRALGDFDNRRDGRREPDEDDCAVRVGIGASEGPGFA